VKTAIHRSRYDRKSGNKIADEILGEKEVPENHEASVIDSIISNLINTGILPGGRGS
jgi:hypothetical protein